MKQVIFLILTIIFCSCGQKKNNENNIDSSYKDSNNNVITKIDSLTVHDDKFALNPFPSKIDFNYFINHIKADYKYIDIMEPYFSDEIDTFKVLKWGNSYVKALANKDVKEFFLIELLISDTNFVLNRNIKIGQSAESIFKKFNAKFDKNKNYKFLQVETKEAAYNSVYFYFTKNTLTSFEYNPYTG